MTRTTVPWYTWMGGRRALRRDASASSEGILPMFPLDWIKRGQSEEQSRLCLGSGSGWIGPGVPLSRFEAMS